MPRDHDVPAALELQRANEELAVLKEFNEAVVQAIPSSVLVFDSDLRLLYANDHFFDTWHYPSSCIGKPLHALFPHGVAEREGWIGMLNAALEDGQSYLGQTMEHHCPQRGRTMVRFSIVPFQHRRQPPSNGSGRDDLVCLEFLARVCSLNCRECVNNARAWQGKKVMLILNDITEQHAMEQQLIQSEKLAGLGQLSAGIAHELRNPLSAINAAAFYVSGALKSEETTDLEELTAYLGLIRRNVARAEKIVHDILDFARPSGPRPCEINLSELVERTLFILDKTFVDHRVTLHADLQPTPPVFCRPDTVKQAVLNLVVNALQAMPDGGDLHVRVHPSGERSVVEVRDTGPGIPADLRHRVFDPFFTTKEPGQGTGLGLSIARTAVEADGGRIWVRSEEGQGTTFFIDLPWATLSPDQAQLQESANESPRQATAVEG